MDERNENFDEIAEADRADLKQQTYDDLKKLAAPKILRHEMSRIEQEWAAGMKTPFPGWHITDWMVVGAWAGLSLDEILNLNGFEVYRRAIPMLVKAANEPKTTKETHGTLSSRTLMAIITHKELKHVTDERELREKLQAIVGGSDRQWQPSGTAGKLISSILAMNANRAVVTEDEIENFEGFRVKR